MKSNSILDFTAVCLAMIPIAPFAAMVSTMRIDHAIDRLTFRIVVFVLLGICASIGVGVRCVLENVLVRVTEAFPAMSLPALTGLQLFLLIVIALLLLFVSICVLPDGEHLIMVFFCFWGVYGFYFGMISLYYQS